MHLSNCNYLMVDLQLSAFAHGMVYEDAVLGLAKNSRCLCWWMHQAYDKAGRNEKAATFEIFSSLGNKCS